MDRRKAFDSESYQKRELRRNTLYARELFKTMPRMAYRFAPERFGLTRMGCLSDKYWRELYQRYSKDPKGTEMEVLSASYPSILGLCLRLTDNFMLLEDMIQEALYLILANLPFYDVGCRKGLRLYLLSTLVEEMGREYMASISEGIRYSTYYAKAERFCVTYPRLPLEAMRDAVTTVYKVPITDKELIQLKSTGHFYYRIKCESRNNDWLDRFLPKHTTDYEKFYEAFSRLRPQQQALLRRRYGMDSEEGALEMLTNIAEETKITRQSVFWKVKNALKQLKRHLEDVEFKF